MTDPLAGTTVLIAGAGSGMGRATARLAAAAGARTLLLGRSRPGLEATAAAACGGEVFVADAADPAALAAALAGTLAEVDVLVNSVGTNIPGRAFDRLTRASWAEMIATNLTAAFNLAQAVLPAMRARGRGLVVNIASTAARKPDMSGAAYQAAKAGVVALTHAIMEEEWANGIRATAILPGMTDTPLLDRRSAPVPAEARAKALQPEDVAAACLFVMRLPERAHVPELIIQPSRR